MINLFKDINIANILYKSSQTLESLTGAYTIATLILEWRE